MLAADIPRRFEQAFAAQAGTSYIRTIPNASQIGIQNGAASLTDGFPPLTFVPDAAGGVPPFGQDMNGILNVISAWARWQTAGGPSPYNAAFSAAIAGYPAGALVASAATAGLMWLSIVDANTTDPDAAGANWIPVYTIPKTRLITASGAFTIAVTDRSIGMNRTAAVATSSAPLPSTNLYAGFEVSIEDLVGNFQAFPVTITPPAGTIAGLANVVLNVNRQCARFRYYGTNLWSVKL